MRAESITNKGFLDEFRGRDQVVDRRFCFIIGAGASVQSQIPSGGELVNRWIHDLHKREDSQGSPIEQWATSTNLEIDGFEYTKAASFYPQVFKRRFREDRELGYAFLHNVMRNQEPSYGYSVLAQILANTRHNVVITTNFDNLIADALSIYTRTLPFISGHESLARFVTPHLRYPLIAKIHRDLLLEPINTPEEMAALHPLWVEALTALFAVYTPMVIGYGGNDGTLMKLFAFS